MYVFTAIFGPFYILQKFSPKLPKSSIFPIVVFYMSFQGFYSSRGLFYILHFFKQWLNILQANIFDSFTELFSQFYILQTLLNPTFKKLLIVIIINITSHKSSSY